MICEYYEKTERLSWLKRVKGYCMLQKCDIYKKNNVDKISCKYCEGLKDKSYLNCGVYACFARSRRK